MDDVIEFFFNLFAEIIIWVAPTAANNKFWSFLITVTIILLGVLLLGGWFG